MRFLPLLLIIVSFPYLNAQSNSYHKALSDSLDVYFEANKEKDYDIILNNTYQKLFKISSREEVLSAFESAEQQGISFEIENSNIQNISEIIVHEKEQFVLVAYQMDMTIAFEGDEYDNEDVLNMIHQNFKNQYGEENVKREGKIFSIKNNSKMFAIAPVKSYDWKFLESKSDDREFLEKLIPTYVLDSFAL